MTIGELSRQGGIPASTIRYYESIGILPKPARTGGKRIYSADALPRLALLKLAQDCGFTLQEIRQLLHGFRSNTPPSQRWQTLARRKQIELDAQMARIAGMKGMLDLLLGCRCLDLAECGRRLARIRETGAGS